MESLSVGVDDIDHQYTDLWDRGLAEPGLHCCVLISVTASSATPHAYISHRDQSQKTYGSEARMWWKSTKQQRNFNHHSLAAAALHLFKFIHLNTSLIGALERRMPRRSDQDGKVPFWICVIYLTHCTVLWKCLVFASISIRTSWVTVRFFLWRMLLDWGINTVLYI